MTRPSARKGLRLIILGAMMIPLVWVGFYVADKTYDALDDKLGWLRAHPEQRFLNKLYAEANGYFWLPCPICGEYFGGQEEDSVGIVAVPGDRNQHLGVCPKCTAIYRAKTGRRYPPFRYVKEEIRP